MTHETAGDPVRGLKWTHRTTAKLADELRGPGPQPRTRQRPRLPLRRRRPRHPYGIYDLRANAGTVFVGRTADTPGVRRRQHREVVAQPRAAAAIPKPRPSRAWPTAAAATGCTARAWKFNFNIASATGTACG